jgi:hypothetical protein
MHLFGGWVWWGISEDDVDPSTFMKLGINGSIFLLWYWFGFGLGLWNNLSELRPDCVLDLNFCARNSALACSGGIGLWGVNLLSSSFKTLVVFKGSGVGSGIEWSILLNSVSITVFNCLTDSVKLSIGLGAGFIAFSALQLHLG